MKTVRKCTVILVAIMLVLGSLSLVQAASRALTVMGAAEMAGIVSSWARLFEKENSGSVVVFGSNDEEGYRALIEGRAHVAMVTKEPTNETKLAASKLGIAIERRKVGWNGIVIIASAALPVDRLSIDQLSKIYTGEYTNWQQLGGPDLPIRLFGLDPKLHGEGAWLKGEILKGAPFAKSVDMVEKQRLMMLRMTKDPGAIGYGSFGIYRAVVRGLPRLEKKVKLLSVSRDDTSPAVEPSTYTIANMSYPLVKPSYLCVNATVVRSDVPLFVDFCKTQSETAMASAPRGDGKSDGAEIVNVEAKIDSDPTH